MNAIPLSKLAKNASRKFHFDKYDKVVFINTGDVLNNEFLHNKLSEKDTLPGQAKKSIKKGDILYSEIRPGNGRYLFVNKDLDNYVVSTKFMVIEANQDLILPEYLFLILTSSDVTEYFKVIAEARSGTFPQITFDAISHYEINTPNKVIQKEIVDYIFSLDQKIQLNTQTNQTLEAIAQAIFKSWFVDFDPVRAKAAALGEGKSEHEANLAAMSVICGKDISEMSDTEYKALWQIADAFPSELVENAEFGEVPKGWEVSTIGEVANITKGKSYKSSELEPSSTALVTLKSFNRGGGYRLDGLKEYSGIYKAEQEVFSGDLIIAYTDVTQAADIIGKPAMVMSDSRYKHLVISLDVGVVRPQNKNMKYFLYCLAMTDIFQSHTKSFCTGTTVLHLSKEAVPSFKFPNPAEEIIQLFDKLVSPMFININRNIEENKQLEKTRDLLLPKLLSGEMEL